MSHVLELGGGPQGRPLYAPSVAEGRFANAARERTANGGTSSVLLSRLCDVCLLLGLNRVSWSTALLRSPGSGFR